MRDRLKAMAMSVIPIVLFCSLVFAGKQTNEGTIVQDNSIFAIALYQKLRASDDNIFFSPYSISTTLAMTYAGARGNTEMEMKETLRFSLRQEHLHLAFAEVESRIKKLQKAGGIKLSVANSLWPQQGSIFLDEYLSLIKKHYGVSITPVDYLRARESARKRINGWVENKTHDKIKDLIQPGILDTLTRLVLVNAIYFKGNWESQFKTSLTKEAPFYISSSKSVRAPIMTQKQKFKYAKIETLQVLELPYVGGELSMVLLLPQKTDGLKRLESSLTIEKLSKWKSRLGKREVHVFLPKFKMTSLFRLDNALMSMGMVDAFNDSKANFSGMDGKSNWLYIGAVLHKAFVDVNEEGTEATAATAVVMKEKGMIGPLPTFRADHPFLFLIQDNQTGSILFMGRVVDPTKIDQ